MNKLFVTGIVITDPIFKFVISDKKISSVVFFYFKLQNETILEVYAINEKADEVYRKIKKDEYLLINGEMRNAKLKNTYIRKDVVLLENFIKINCKNKKN